MRTQLLVSLFLSVGAGAAQANVIEIADDGEARVLGTSTLSGHVNGRPSPIGVTDPAADPFENAARRHKVDVNLLKAVAWTESRGRNDAISPKGARGVMQLMPATAAALGVDPRDPVANIDGGAAYLAQQLATFHDVPLALAAYNAGPRAVMRYRGVPPYRETRNYVSTIMFRWQGTVMPGAASSAYPTAAPTLPTGIKALPVEPIPVLLIEVPSL